MPDCLCSSKDLSPKTKDLRLVLLLWRLNLRSELSQRCADLLLSTSPHDGQRNISSRRSAGYLVPEGVRVVDLSTIEPDNHVVFSKPRSIRGAAGLDLSHVHPFSFFHIQFLSQL